MMTKMRESLHIVLYALVVVFVLTIFLEWGAGGADVLSDKNLAGRIGDKKITLQQFDQIYRQRVQTIKQQYGRDLPEEQADQFRKQVWKELVNEYVLQQELDQRGLALTDSEFVYGAYNDPNPYFKQNPDFLVDGKFNVEKLKENITKNPNLAYYLQNMYKQTFSQKAMQLFVDKSSHISEAEVLETYKEENLKAKFKFIGVEKFRLRNDSFKVDSTETLAYYNSNRDNYQTAEKRKIEYIRIDIKATQEDTTIISDELAEIKANIAGGADFSEEMIALSDDAQTEGVEPEFVAAGTNSEAFDKIVLTASKDEIVGPFLDGSSFKLVKILEKQINKETKKEEVKYLEIVKNIQVGATTAQNFDFIAEEARNIAVDGGDLKAFASDKEVYYNETSYFANNGLIPGIGQNLQLSEFVFSKDAGSVSREIRKNKSQTIYIVKVLDVKSSGYEEFKTVERRIKNTIINEKRTAKVKEIVTGYAEKLKTMSFEEVAATDKENNPVVGTTELVNSYGKRFSKIGQSAEVSKAVNSIELQTQSDVLVSDVGAFVIKVEERNNFDEADYNAKKAEIRERLTNQQGNLFNSWLADATKKYEVEEYRLY